MRLLCPVVSVPPAKVMWRRKVWDHSGVQRFETVTASDELEVSEFALEKMQSFSRVLTQHSSAMLSALSEIEPQYQRHLVLHSLLVKTVSEQEYNSEFSCFASVEYNIASAVFNEASAVFRFSKPSRMPVIKIERLVQVLNNVSICNLFSFSSSILAFSGEVIILSLAFTGLALFLLFALIIFYIRYCCCSRSIITVSYLNSAARF